MIKMNLKNNKGFSLMEVLIAMIVISIGLLGFMSLQLTSINSNQEGMAKSQANLIMQDMAAKFRSNKEYIFSAEGDSLYLSANNDYNDCDGNSPATCTGASANCTTEQQAQFDVWSICRTLNSNTPNSDTDDPILNGNLFVSCNSRDGVAGNCAAGSTLTAYMYWAMAERRQDVGQVTSSNANGVLSQRCNDYAEADAGVSLDNIGAEVDCVALDLMP